MKKCARCGQVYLDEGLNFCLTDGEPLASPNISVPTVVLNPAISAARAPISEKQGVSPVFAYLSIALAALIIGGGVVGIVLWFLLSGRSDSSATYQNVQANSRPAVNDPAYVQPPPAATPVIVRVPTAPSSSKTTGLKFYTGSVGGSPASFNLVWNKDRTISGTYFSDGDPGVVYTVVGTNYVEGTSELRVSNGNDFMGQMRLEKRIEGNMLCWQGNFTVQNQYVRFCRRR